MFLSRRKRNACAPGSNATPPSPPSARGGGRRVGGIGRRSASACRVAAGLVGALAAIPVGCCNPCCPNGGATVVARPGTIRQGEVCDVPASGASSAVAGQPGSRAASMASAPRPRVVVSEPSGRLPGQAGWRRTDPESIATRVEGAIDDESINR